MSGREGRAGGAAQGIVAGIRGCAERTGVRIDDSLARQLGSYVELLRRWNTKLNLTRLDRDDAGLERLVIEPLAALPHLPVDGELADIGSGGGSPAIPLKLARPGLGLHMVEARSRKAAFLREAVRRLGLDRTRVAAERYERLAERRQAQGGHDVLTVRGVAVDQRVLRYLRLLVRPGGKVLLFRGAGSAEAWANAGTGLVLEAVEPLPGACAGRLVVLRRPLAKRDDA